MDPERSHLYHIQRLEEENKNMKYGFNQLVKMDVLNHNVESIIAKFLEPIAIDYSVLIEHIYDNFRTCSNDTNRVCIESHYYADSDLYKSYIGYDPEYDKNLFAEEIELSYYLSRFPGFYSDDDDIYSNVG